MVAAKKRNNSSDLAGPEGESLLRCLDALYSMVNVIGRVVYSLGYMSDDDV